MERIELKQIKKKEGGVCYNFDCSESLNKYFTEIDFCITYPESIEIVPDGVLAIPFVTNTLQIAWLADCELIIPELDRDFYESIPKFLEGFKKMYPEATFAGKLTVGKITDCKPQSSGESATLFSGGLDATTTLLRHIDENPHLISIWGSDVDYDNETGWHVVEGRLRETAEQYKLPLVVIRSRFRQFDNVVSLTADFQEVLQTSWWYGVKHGIGLIGHVAPYAWLHGLNMVYIASSNCPEDGVVRCASDPTIDSNVEFCGSKVFHDAFELNRQKKTNYIAQYHRRHPEQKIYLHVCWKSESGSNCCSCEKCYRTMVGLWICGEEPADFGFHYEKKIFERIYQLIALREEHIPAYSWTYMKNDLIEKWDELKEKPYRKYLKWMLNFDFFHPEENECRKKYKATWRFKRKIVDRYPRLYKIYIKLRGYSYE